MATTLSTQVTNLQASPRVLNPVGLAGGRERVCQGNFEVVANDFDANGDEIHLCTLPGNARVTSILLGGDTMDSGTDTLVNVGFSRVSSVDPSTTTIIDEDYFSTVLTIFQAASRLTEAVDDANTAAAIADWGERLWEIAGDSTDTGTYFNITMTQTATVSGAQLATVKYAVKYVID